MADTHLIQDDPTELVTRLEEASGTLEQGVLGRLAALREVGSEWTSFRMAIEAKGLSLVGLALLIIGTALVTHLIIVGIHRLLRTRVRVSKGWKRGALLVISTLAAFVVMFGVTRFAVADLDLRRVLRIWIFAVALFGLAGAALLSLFPTEDHVHPDIPVAGIRRFRDTVGLGVLWALAGIALSATLRTYQAGPGLRDLIGTLVVALPVAFILSYAYARYRHVVRMLIASPGGSRAREHLAGMWPWVAIAVIVFTWITVQIASTLGSPLPPLAIFSTLVLVLVAPHLDGIVARWSERGIESPHVSIVAVAMRRTTRFLIAIAILCLLLYLWVVPLLSAFGIEAAAVARSVTEIGLIGLVAAFLWNAIGTLVSRVAQSEGHSGTLVEVAGPRSRLGTLLPLMSGAVKGSILALTMLTVLIAVGINVWPIIGGLSIFGIAIGFGSQTLVKDIVSGLFFLIDDAFRLGEYIEAPGAKGTVEKISVRSVSLRNARGALASVPYGQIGKVVNFSRGWVIEKLVFRVAFDTDVDKVRKLFKVIGQEISDDPELSKDLLEPFKSQGISAVEDGTLIIRGKFKARAGQQFAVKKAVLTAVQKAFRENDIHVVARIPPILPPAT